MKSILIGTSKAGDPVRVEIDILLKSRLLIQGNSGAGKSWLVRRLAEQLFGVLPVLLIDPEGEFATLRERYGYVLVGKGGETPADPRSAELVATKLLELHASAVCDLYEMKPAARHEWVKLFLDALLDAPKKLWQPLVVIVDEAHLFVPEKGAGESEAADAMIGLATRGRKRGFCPVWATQRLAKVRKDAAAELQNVLIGSTFIDVDRERAAEALGIARADKPAFFDQLKVMPEGHFWGFGRAIALERVLVKIGPVATTHPEPGSSKHAAEPPPAPEKVRALLPRLADLPAEAAARSRTLTELQAENADLKRRLRATERAQPPASAAPTEKRVEVPVWKESDLRRLEAAGRLAVAHGQRAIEHGQRLIQHGQAVVEAGRRPATPAPTSPRIAMVRSQQTGTTPAEVLRRPTAVMVSRSAEPGSLPGPDRKLLTALAQHGERSITALALLTGYAATGGAFKNPLSRLRTAGSVEPGDPVRITDAGLRALGDWTPLPTGAALLAYWLGHLPGPDAKLLRAAADVYPREIPVDELAEATGYEVTGGAFKNPLSRLRTLTLVSGRSAVRAAAELFG